MYRSGGFQPPSADPDEQASQRRFAINFVRRPQFRSVLTMATTKCPPRRDNRRFGKPPSRRVQMEKQHADLWSRTLARSSGR